MNYLNEGITKENIVDFNYVYPKQNDLLMNKLNQTKAYINEDSSIDSNNQTMLNSNSESDSKPLQINNNYSNVEHMTQSNKNEEIIQNPVLGNDLRKFLIQQDNNYFIVNNQLNSFIEKLLFDQNFKVENCSGQSYYLDINNKQSDVNISENQARHINRENPEVIHNYKFN